MMKIDYKLRQKKALDAISGGAMLVMAMPEALRNGNVHHPYRQHSFVHYLCGATEQETCLLLVNTREHQKVITFVRPKDPVAELWEGRRLGVEESPAVLQVDQAEPIQQLFAELPKYLKGSDRLYYTVGQKDDAAVFAALKQERRLRGRLATASMIDICDADKIAASLRITKDVAEQAAMRRAAQISARAFDRVFRELRPGMNERDVHGMLLSEFLLGGGEMEAYPSIVAGGRHACCLHYRANNAVLEDGQLILIDAGAQYQYYASDVTRSFPIGKMFTSEQKAVYEAVLDAQLLGISLSKPGSTLDEIHRRICHRLSEHLVTLGLLQASVQEIADKHLYRKYYPHGSGHWLGLDVHDIGDYISNDVQPMKLSPGMVFTVEPGIYIDANDESVGAAWRGIGVRIEDDVLINDQGCEVLTAAIAKQVNQLENRG